MGTKVRVEATGFSSKQLEKLSEAAALLERVINSSAFAEEVLNFSYQYSTGALWWKRWFTSKNFRWNNGDTRAQVLEKILAGNELKSGADQEVDCIITLYTGDPGVLGYTYPSTLKTWINSHFFNDAPIYEIAGNLAHEYCHKLGYDHEYNRTSLRDYTAPYAIGYMVSRLGKEVLATDKAKASNLTLQTA